MADKKISALTAATTPLAGTEVLPVVQGGSTVKVSVANLTAGRATNALKQSVASFTPDGGGFIHEASAASVTSRYWRTANDVSAWADWALQQSTDNTGAAYTTRFYFDGNGNATVSSGNLVVGTAGKGIDFSANGGDVLTQYDEGTFTPSQGANLIVVGSFSSTGTYTRIGRLVFVTISLSGSTSVAWNASASVICGNLPFAVASGGSGTGVAHDQAWSGTSTIVADGGSSLVRAATAMGPTPTARFSLVYSV